MNSVLTRKFRNLVEIEEFIQKADNLMRIIRPKKQKYICILEMYEENRIIKYLCTVNTKVLIKDINDFFK